MENLITWMNEKVAPSLTKITDHPLIASINDGFSLALPSILVGVFSMIANILRDYISWIPDLSAIQNFSFALMGLFVVFGITYKYVERKLGGVAKVEAGFLAIGAYLLLSGALVNPETAMFEMIFERLGAAGIFAAVVVGWFTGAVVVFFTEKNLFGRKGNLPPFITTWFNAIASGFVVLIVSWLSAYQFGIDVYALIETFFGPLVAAGQSFTGFVMINGVGIFLYAFGISPWALASIMFPIMMTGIAENADLVAQGLAATNINTMEAGMAFVYLGGMGMTLMLNFFMLRSKSLKLRVLGKTTILPSLLNINEPMVFGIPIAWNPTLMIPFIINGFLIPAIVYVVLNAGLVTIPSQPFWLWFLPVGISTYLVTLDWRSLVLLIVTLAISGLVYYPFFKVYERQMLEKEDSKVEN